jgi:hypothetical protein
MHYRPQKKMVDHTEKERLMRSGGERLLMVLLASAISGSLSITKSLPLEESILIGWTVGYLVGYWLPPRPTLGFIRWTLERIVMTVAFYAVVLKAPTLVAPLMNAYVAIGIALVMFFAMYFAWTRHPKSTLRFGQA